MIDAVSCNLKPPEALLGYFAASSNTSCGSVTKIHANIVVANYKARLLSDTLDTSLGTNSCGSLQLRNAAEANSHIYNSKQGPFSKAVVREEILSLKSDVLLLHHSGNQAYAQHLQQADMATSYSGASHRV